MQQLDEIHQQIIDFAKRVSALQQNDAGLCDAQLNVPAWKSTELGQPERFVSTAVLGNVARFSVHFELLKTGHPAISEDNNKKSLTSVSVAILDQARLFAQSATHGDDKAFSATLVNALESADKAIQAYSGPSASPAPK